VVIYVYVEDVDKTVEQAVGAGAKILIPAKDQFWGDRTAWFMDPSGHVWTVATRVEETTEEERRARLARSGGLHHSSTMLDALLGLHWTARYAQ
jgi:PhnB protein